MAHLENEQPAPVSVAEVIPADAPARPADRPSGAHAAPDTRNAAQKVHDHWKTAQDGSGIRMQVPGTYKTLHLNNVVLDGNSVRVWVNGNTSDSPDYVIVNPPTQVQISRDNTEDNPLGAIAQAIDGASK